MRWASAASASTASTPAPASARRSRTARPDRVAAVAANGLVVLTEAEREAILRDYLPPLVPRWDGGHLAWLWARMREQAIFFPWHDRRAATRMDFDVPPADRLHSGLLEFLAAGDQLPRRLRAPRSWTGRNAGCPRCACRCWSPPGAGPAGGSSGPDRSPLRPASRWRLRRTAAAALDRAFAHLKSHPGDTRAAVPAAAEPTGPRGR